MFDFDATLPLMAVQFLLLMAVLNAVFYKPLTKAIDERNGYIQGSRSEAKERLVKAEAIAQQYEQELGETRRQAQSVVAEAQSEAQQIVAQRMAEAQREAQAQRESVQSELDQQKQEAMAALEGQVDDLSNQILHKLLSV